MRVLAFDVSKGKSYVVLYDDQICIDEFEVHHNQDGFNHIKKILHGVETEVVFEATGVYSQPLEALLQSEGIAFYKLNPLLAKMQTQTPRSNKTDRVDAHKQSLAIDVKDCASADLIMTCAFTFSEI